VRSDLRISDDEWKRAAAHTKAVVRGVVPASLVLQAVVLFVAGWLVTTYGRDLSDRMVALWVGIVVLSLLTPLVFIMSYFASRPTLQQFAESLARERELNESARRRDFETGVVNALEMADNEPRVLSVAKRALSMIVPDGQVDVLLADNSQAHVERVLTAGERDDAGCPVESPDRCAAARRGQTQIFNDSDAIDSCPYLQERPIGRCAAVCVPLSIMGRTVGVVHRVHQFPFETAEAASTEIEVVANQLGNRLGVLRLLAETQLQANTDALTGLPNRRAFESAVRRLRLGGAPYCVIIADLDHFKTLNDTHGHESGDRALRNFATMLRAELRPGDIAARYGGEEFALALPGCSAAGAVSTCERLREALALLGQAGGSPSFTASYGIAPAHDDVGLDELLSEADLALYQAKRNGRDRAVLYDPLFVEARMGSIS
jgi:diguanylate cyclase (GGDEF)-like protein